MYGCIISTDNLSNFHFLFLFHISISFSHYSIRGFHALSFSPNALKGPSKPRVTRKICVIRYFQNGKPIVTHAFVFVDIRDFRYFVSHDDELY